VVACSNALAQFHPLFPEVSIDVAHATVLQAGGFVPVGANMHHYAIARGHTVVQVHAMGPFALTYVNPKDAPPSSSHSR
jgi:hypothetical protein